MTRYYFDHNATTPVSPEVFEAMAPLLREDFGNASSIHHYGQRAKQHLETARRQVAGLIHAQPQEIVFLSGGTEADNLALFGVVRNSPGSARHVITTAIEHPAVAVAATQNFIGQRRFKEILFKSGLPWVYVFDGLRSSDDGTLVVLGDLGAIYDRSRTLFRGVKTQADATLTLPDAGGQFVLYDFYGNPLPAAGGRISVPLNGLGYFLRTTGVR